MRFSIVTAVLGSLSQFYGQQTPFSDPSISNIYDKPHKINTWYIGGSHPDLYKCGISDLPYHDKRSASLRPKKPEAPDTVGACIMQIFKADRNRGNRMRFSAAVKTDQVYKSGLWMNVNDPDGILASDFMHYNRPITPVLPYEPGNLGFS